MVPSGILPRLRAWLVGERAARLSEHAQGTHLLSYLLILSQSIAVVLVLGHAELPLLFDRSLAIRALATMGVFVLIATVLASDLALLETLRRIPVLARNRQRALLREHLTYTGFVLLVEASTYAVVLAALDSNPRALVTSQPLIPASGPIFVFQVVLRAVLVCWTAVQLVIVRGRLPVLLSTLTNTGKELVGAHVEHQLADLDIGDVALPDTFRLYAAMARPPRRVRTPFNGFIVQRELAQEAEEERQVRNVVDALEELERRRVAANAGTVPEISGTVPEETVRTSTVETPSRPPTGPGSPTRKRPVRTRRKTAAPRRIVALPSAVRTPEVERPAATVADVVRTPDDDYERIARAAWAEGHRTIKQMERVTGMSHTAAASWTRALRAEAKAGAANSGKVAR